MENLKNLAKVNDVLTPEKRDFLKKSQVTVELPTKETCMNLGTNPFIPYICEME